MDEIRRTINSAIMAGGGVGIGHDEANAEEFPKLAMAKGEELRHGIGLLPISPFLHSRFRIVRLPRVTGKAVSSASRDSSSRSEGSDRIQVAVNEGTKENIGAGGDRPRIVKSLDEGFSFIETNHATVEISRRHHTGSSSVASCAAFTSATGISTLPAARSGTTVGVKRFATSVNSSITCSICSSLICGSERAGGVFAQTPQAFDP
jgi:hypothetical protein